MDTYERLQMGGGFEMSQQDVSLLIQFIREEHDKLLKHVVGLEGRIVELEAALHNEQVARETSRRRTNELLVAILVLAAAELLGVDISALIALI